MAIICDRDASRLSVSGYVKGAGKPGTAPSIAYETLAERDVLFVRSVATIILVFDPTPSGVMKNVSSSSPASRPTNTPPHGIDRS